MKNIRNFFKNKIAVRIAIAVIVIIAVIGGWLFFELFHARIFIDNSLIDAPIVSVIPQTTGILNDMRASEGQLVHKGDVIAVVNGEPLVTNTDGIVIMANRAVGSSVSSLNPVVQIINQPQMRVAGTIDENKGLNDIRVGQVISFTVDALPGRVFWGYVDNVSPSAKQTQLAFSISSERPTQQFIVYAKFNAAAYPDIKNGMSAKITVYTNTY